jgi:hypothetical protein
MANNFCVEYQKRAVEDKSTDMDTLNWLAEYGDEETSTKADIEIGRRIKMQEPEDFDENELENHDEYDYHDDEYESSNDEHRFSSFEYGLKP